MLYYLIPMYTLSTGSQRTNRNHKWFWLFVAKRPPRKMEDLVSGNTGNTVFSICTFPSFSLFAAGEIRSSWNSVCEQCTFLNYYRQPKKCLPTKKMANSSLGQWNGKHSSNHFLRYVPTIERFERTWHLNTAWECFFCSQSMPRLSISSAFYLDIEHDVHDNCWQFKKINHFRVYRFIAQ